jgi:hypothetical protein
MVNRLIKESNKLNDLRAKKGNLSNEDYDTISENFKVVFR